MMVRVSGYGTPERERGPDLSTSTPTPATTSAPAQAPAAPAPVTAPRRFLDRGESLIASVGLAAAAVLLLTMAASAWWALREKRAVAEDARQTQVRALADHLEQSATAMLASNDLSALRRAVAAVGQNNPSLGARVTLTDGRVLADAEPSKISPGEVPERFPSGPIDAPERPAEAADAITLHRPMIIPGRGAAMLEVIAPAAVASSSWSLAAGLALMCAFGLSALWLVYRHMRVKVRTLALIRDGLLAMRTGERAREVLEIAGEPGPEVAAWNDLLKEAEALRKGTLMSQLSHVQERRKESKSELELACD